MPQSTMDTYSASSGKEFHRLKTTVGKDNPLYPTQPTQGRSHHASCGKEFRRLMAIPNKTPHRQRLMPTEEEAANQGSRM